MKINEVIQTKRKELNMTQLQLAEKLDVSDKTVSRWELGTIYPNVDVIPKIAIALGVGINELFGDNAIVNETVNDCERRDYRKIALLKVFLYILIGGAITSSILFFSGINASETSSKTSAILIICSFITFALSSIAFYINRALFSAFYKEKFYIKEYKRLDARNTTLANFINSFVVGGILLFSPKFNIIGIAIFTVILILNLFFLKRLGYHYHKKAQVPLIIASVIYLGFFLLFIYSLVGHPNIIAIPYIIANGILNSLTCFSLLCFIRDK